MMKPSARKLPGMRGSLTSLWVAEDHLLQITGEGFILPLSEKYARFYFRDIEALHTVRRRGRGVNVTLGGLAALALLIMLSVNDDPVAFGTLATISGAFLLALVIRLLRPRVELHIQTAPGSKKLAQCSPRRGRQVIAELTPLILAAQADLPPLPTTQPSSLPPPRPA